MIIFNLCSETMYNTRKSFYLHKKTQNHKHTIFFHQSMKDHWLYLNLSEFLINENSSCPLKHYFHITIVTNYNNIFLQIITQTIFKWLRLPFMYFPPSSTEWRRSSFYKSLFRVLVVIIVYCSFQYLYYSVFSNVSVISIYLSFYTSSKLIHMWKITFLIYFYICSYSISLSHKHVIWKKNSC